MAPADSGRLALLAAAAPPLGLATQSEERALLATLASAFSKGLERLTDDPSAALGAEADARLQIAPADAGRGFRCWLPVVEAKGSGAGGGWGTTREAAQPLPDAADSRNQLGKASTGPLTTGADLQRIGLRNGRLETPFSVKNSSR